MKVNEIVYGPEREDFIRLFSERKQLEFLMPSGGLFAVVLSSLEFEDKTGESFLFRGFAHPRTNNPLRIEGYYNCSTQKGWVRAVQFER